MLRSVEPGGSEEPTVPAATAAAWRTAEAQLFGALLNRPDLYRSVIELVADTVDRLRQLGPSTVALCDAAPAIGGLVRESARLREATEARELPAAGIDPDLMGRAALALRHREVVAEQAASRRIALVAAARAGHLLWAVLEESGDGAGDLYAPYRRLEVEVTSGRALLVTTSPDDDFQTCQHSVEVLQVDLDTGGIQAPRGPDQQTLRCRNAAERESHVEVLRERFSRSR